MMREVSLETLLNLNICDPSHNKSSNYTKKPVCKSHMMDFLYKNTSDGDGSVSGIHLIKRMLVGQKVIVPFLLFYAQLI